MQYQTYLIFILNCRLCQWVRCRASCVVAASSVPFVGGRHCGQIDTGHRLVEPEMPGEHRSGLSLITPGLLGLPVITTAWLPVRM
jgi:hypothetical protein